MCKISTIEIISGIYKIQSKIKPDKIYIGSAYNFKERKRTHLKRLRYNKTNNITKGASPKLQYHFNKYGEDDLIFTLIEQVDWVSKEHLLAREQYYIDTLKPWFNICIIAGSSKGIKHPNTKYTPWNKGLTKETDNRLQKMSDNAHGRIVSEETKQKHRDNAVFKREDVKSKIREKRLGKPHPSKNRRKKGEWHPSEETKQKMSIAKKNKKWEDIYTKEGLEKLIKSRQNRKK